MLFLGLGTGLGTALIVDKVAQPMELAHLPYKKHRTFEDYVGEAGLKRLGKKKWRHEVFAVVERLKAATAARLHRHRRRQCATCSTKLPPRCRRGDNANAFKGGFRLWEKDGIIV